MTKYHFKLALASLKKQKSISFINLIGLSCGIVCFIFIFLFVKDELSFDKHHSEYERTYRIVHHIDYEDSGENSVSCPFPVGPALKNEFPGIVENYVRIFNWWGETYTVKREDVAYNETHFAYVDSSFFSVFDFPLLLGKANAVLSGPGKIVLSKKASQKYFGTPQQALGKMLRINDEFDVEITGIMQDMPSQGHFQYDFLCSLTTFESNSGGDISWWWCNPAWTYVLLKPNANINNLKNGFDRFIQKYVPSDKQNTTSFSTQSLADIHLKSNLGSEIRKNGSFSNLIILMSIALIIVLISIINYTNLSTAISTIRGKEIGIRKVLGSSKIQLKKEFFSESFILVAVSLLIALVLFVILLPFFNSLADKSFTLSMLFRFSNLAVLVGFLFFLAVLSGLYPAFFLAQTNAVLTIKGFVTKSRSNLQIRQILIGFQFILSAFLITGSITILKQLQYMQNKDLGFEQEEVLIMNIKNTPLKQTFYEFADELNKTNSVISTTFMENYPGKEFYTEFFYHDGAPADKPGQLYKFARVQHDFVKTLNINIISGRDYSKKMETDPENAILINEAMVKHLGWTNENALGRKFHFHNQERVIGVMEDFHYHSLHQKVEPIAIDLVRPNTGQHNWATNYIAIKIAPENYQKTLNEIDRVWAKFAPGFPFEYSFLDDKILRNYESEVSISRITSIFSVVAVLLACLGIFGLFKYSIERKTKEIAIRKVLGSSIFSISSQLMKELVFLIFMAMIIAIPLSWIALDKWLQNFQYSISVDIGIFILSFLLLLLPPAFIIFNQSIRAAKANPVETLNYE